MSTTAFPLTIITPTQTLAAMDVTYVNVPGEEGDFGVLIGHMPLVSTLRAAGTLTATLPDGSQQAYAISAGFADVQPTGVTILAETASAA